MRKIILMTVLAALTPCLFFSSVEAKRAGAPKVEPLVYKGVKFIAPNTPQRMGYVEAWDVTTNTKVWEKKVYTVVSDRKVEGDVQWVFISFLKIEDGRLIVSDERGKEYKVDIPKNMLKEDIQPLQLIIKSDKDVYNIGEDIILSGEIKNASKQNILIYPLEISATVTFDVIDSQGNKIDVPLPIIDLWPPKKDDFVLLQSAKSLPKTFKLFIPEEIVVPGSYTILVKYDIWEEGYYENGKFIDLNAWTGNLISNAITIKVTEKKGASKDISSQRSSKIIKRSVGQGDYVRDERNPAEACNLLIQEVRDSNPGMDCKVINSGRVDSPENFAECVDGATVAGCFTCIFECK